MSKRKDVNAASARAQTSLTDIRTVLEEELDWVYEEQRRCRALIRDAVSRLSDAFVRMRENAPEADADSAAQVARAAAFQQASSEAIKALQFEDIAAQGLEGAEQGIEYLKELLAELDRDLPSRDRIASILRRHRRMRAERRNRDEQSDMSDHDIDLF